LHAGNATYRWVQVDEDGTGYVFAIAGLGEEGLERPALVEVLRIRIRATISLETVLKQVPGRVVSIRIRGIRVGFVYVQLPGAVAQLRAGLADVEMANLRSSLSA
jgi:hypothetical protein